MNLASSSVVGGFSFMIVDGIVIMVQIAFDVPDKENNRKHNGTAMMDNKSK